MSKYTTIAVTEDDKSRLDQLCEQSLDEDVNNSYRDIINFLIDEFEDQQDEYEHILAKAIATSDESDAKRVISRVNADKNFVEGLNDE